MGLGILPLYHSVFIALPDLTVLHPHKWRVATLTVVADPVIGMPSLHLELESRAVISPSLNAPRYHKALYPSVKYAIHGGELALGLVSPDLLSFHVQDAVLVGGAQRVGHGVDIFWEPNNTAVLSYMAKNKVVIEFCLTSNEFILKVQGSQHPLPLYLASGVPAIIGSDDPGILRGSISEEYVKLVSRYSQFVDYPRVKELIRNSIRYSFIKEASVKARILADLELRFKAFEAATKVKAAMLAKLEKSVKLVTLDAPEL